MVDETTRVDDPAQFPPQEDTVERLWTPQRMTYVLRNDEGKVTKPKTKECPFCAGPNKSDEDGLIAWRGTHVFAIMNLYPYNVGHLMICPYRHVSLITDLDDAELFEFEKATTLAMTVMKEVSHPDGWNIGINQGEVAGAGIAAPGTVTRTSCRSWRRPARCRSCCPTSAPPTRRRSIGWRPTSVCRPSTDCTDTGGRCTVNGSLMRM